MQSRLVFLKPKPGKKRSLPRFYVEANPDSNYDGAQCLIEGEFPIYLEKYKVAYDQRPTLSHFLSKNEFPAILGFSMVSKTRTKIYDGTMLELYRESIHHLKRNRIDYLLSALRWPTGIPTLEFIEFYYDELIYLSETDLGTVNKYLKLLIKASGLYFSSVEDQIVEIHRRTLLEGKKYGLNHYDLTGNDIIADICVVQAARVTHSIVKAIPRC
uniref:Nonstructural protein n=2 Tax=Viruses TaxID=10239 RepID=A7KCM7_9VIRU|nr:nonstructural protein [Sandfly fever Naples virus]AFH89005.1 nucleoprotein [Naples virus]